MHKINNKYCPYFKRPNEYQLRVHFLRSVMIGLRKIYRGKRIYELPIDCNILINGSTDRKHISLMNLCMHNKLSTQMFNSTKDLT